MSAVPEDLSLEEQIAHLREEVRVCEKQMLKTYKEGFRAGISRGEKLDQKDDTFREAMFEISQIITQNGYFLADETPSAKGLDNQDIMNIYFITKRAFGTS